MKIPLTIFIILITTVNAIAEENKTLTINERMIRLEIKVEEGFKAVNQRIGDLDKRIDGLDKRIDDLNQRISDLINIVLGGFGITFAGIFGLVGFVLWDRRTVVAPVARELKEVVKQKELILEVLKRYSRTEPKLAEAIRAAGLI